MNIKKVLPFLFFLAILMSCNKEIIEKPDNLIGKDEMVDIMYDLSLLTAMKIKIYSLPDAESINKNEYVFKKYKIDSLQFVKSNSYYASDTKEYAKMIGQVKTRLDKEKTSTAALVKIKDKKDVLIKKRKEKLKQMRIKDSIVKTKTVLKTEKDSIKKYQFIDSNWFLYIDEYLKTPYLKRF